MRTRLLSIPVRAVALMTFRNALKLSGLPHHKSLDEFAFPFQPELDARTVKDLATSGLRRGPVHVAFLGPPGVGKTMLAVRLAIAACLAGLHLPHHPRRHGPPAAGGEATGRFAKKCRPI